MPLCLLRLAGGIVWIVCQVNIVFSKQTSDDESIHRWENNNICEDYVDDKHAPLSNHLRTGATPWQYDESHHYDNVPYIILSTIL